MDPIYTVLLASVLVWGGLFAYLVTVDARMRRLESRGDSEARDI
jgi:hypothetical protein